MTQVTIEDHKARDLMSTDVLSVYEGWSIHRLADFFLMHGVNGAPVMASDHQLVGVVSVSDIFQFENADSETKTEALRACYREATGIDIASRKDLEAWQQKAEYHCTVHQIMTHEVVSVEASSDLGEVAMALVSNGIHRVFVTDQGRIVGVISSTDLLRPLVSPTSYVENMVR